MKEEINFSPKVVIFEDGGSLAPNIPSPYKFNGTKIFRDTTALPFLNGGPLVDKTNHGKLLNSIYASDLGPYHYDMGGNMQQSSPCSPGFIWDGTKCVPEEEFRAGAAANLPAGFAPDAAIKMNQNYSDSSQWTKDYMDSPMYKQMLKNSTKGYDEEYQTIKEGRQNNLAGISPLKFAGQPEGDTSTGGETDMSTGQITAFPAGANLKTLTGHELSHAVNRNPGYGDFIPKNDEDYMIENAYTKYNQSPKYTERAHLYESNPKLEKEDAKTWEQQYRDEIGIPDETVARLRAIRQAAQQNNIYDPYNEKINTEQFQKLQNTPLEENPLWDPLKQLQGTYPNDKIYEMLNTISQNKTDNSNSSVTARNGGFIPHSYALGGNMPGPTDCEVGYIWDGTRCVPEEEYRTAAANKLPKGWTPDAAIDVNNQYRESKNWMQDYFASPEYDRLLKNSTEGNPEEYEDIKNQRQTNLDNINLPTFAAESKVGDKMAGESNLHTGAMTTYPVGINVNSLQTHELSHGVNVGKTNFPGVTYNLIPRKDSELMESGKFNNFKESPEYFNNQSLYEDNKKEFRQDKRHWNDFNRDYVGTDDETVARIRSTKHEAEKAGIWNPKTEPFSPEIYEKLKNTNFEPEEHKAYEAMPQLQNTYKDDTLYKMFRDISKNNQPESIYNSNSITARNGGFIPYKRYDLFDNSLKNGGQFSGSYSLPEDSFRQGGNNLHNSVYASSARQYPAIRENGGGMSFANGGHSCVEGTQWDDDLKTCVKIGLNTLPQVNVSPWAVDMKAEQPTQVSNVLQNLIKKNESNNLKFPGLEPNFNYGPSDAIQSSDWMWQLPIAGKGIGQGIKALGELGGMAIPGLAGTTLGNAATAGFAGHGLTNLALNSPKEWYDVSQGKGDWKEAALNTALHASELMGSGVPKGALNLAKETGNFLKSHPSSWLQSAEERLVNPDLWKSLGHNTSGDPLGKLYNWKDTQALRKAQNKEFKLIDKLPMSWNEEGRGEAVAAIREKLGENSFRNVEKKISKLANERSLERSRLPVQPVRTESGSRVGGGQGQIFLNNLNPEEVIKLGVMPGKEGTLQALVNAGNKVKAEGIPGLENVALPTKAVSFGADPIAGTELGLQFMPWVGKPLNAKNPIAMPFEYGEGSSLAKSKLLETAKGLDKENIGIDYYGQNNIMYDPASDSYKMVDLNYTQGPGKAWNWNKLDLPVQQRLESKFGKFSQPVSEQSQRIVNSSNNFNRIVRKPEPVAKPNNGQQEFAFPTDAPVPSARLSNEEQIIQGMERSREIANEEGNLFNAPMPVDKPRAVNYPDYYSEIMQANKYNGKNKQYFTDLIESVKQQGNVASEKQFDELQRIKSGDYTRGKKSYEMGGYINRNGGELSHFYDSNIQAYNNGGNLYDNVLVFKKKI